LQLRRWTSAHAPRNIVRIDVVGLKEAPASLVLFPWGGAASEPFLGHAQVYTTLVILKLPTPKPLNRRTLTAYTVLFTWESSIRPRPRTWHRIPVPFSKRHATYPTIPRDKLTSAKADRAAAGAVGGFSLFGGRQEKWENASDLYTQAASAFRLQKQSENTLGPRHIM
jgi:hypothetical protein